MSEKTQTGAVQSICADEATTHMRSCLARLSSSVQALSNAVHLGKFIDPAVLEEGINALQAYETAQANVQFQQQTRLDATRVALTDFLRVEIDHEAAKDALTSCKAYVKPLLSQKDAEALVLAGDPYRLFVDIVRDQSLITCLTDQQEVLLNETFPRPLPRLLYSGQFYLPTANVEAPANPSDGPKSNPMPGPESAPKAESAPAPVPESALKTEPEPEPVASTYAFITESKNAEFKATVLIGLIGKNVSGKWRYKPPYGHALKNFLVYLAWCRLVGRTEAERYLIPDKVDFDTFLRPLLKNGYLTKVMEQETGEVFYCLSSIGIQMFRKKTSRDILLDREKLPTLITASDFFQVRQDLIPAAVTVSALMLYTLNDLRNDELSSLEMQVDPYETDGAQIFYAVATLFPPVDHSRHGKRCYLVLIPSAAEGHFAQIAAECALPADSVYYLTASTDRAVSAEDLVGRYADFPQDRTYIVPLGGDGGETGFLLPVNGGQALRPAEAFSSFLGVTETQEPVAAEAAPSVQPEPEGAPPVQTEPEAVAPARATPEVTTPVQAEIETAAPPHARCAPAAAPTELEMTAAQLAETYLSQGVSAERVDFSQLVTRLLAENQVMEAVTLSKCVSYLPATYNGRYMLEKLLLATNIPLGEREYSSTKLAEMDVAETATPFFSSELSRFLRIGSLFWAQAFPAQAYDNGLYSNYKSAINTDLDDLSPDCSNTLKQIAHLLTDDLYDLTTQELDGLGFSPAVFHSLRSDAEKKSNQDSLSERAKAKNRIPKGGIFTGFDTFLARMLGPSSYLGQSMEIIISDNRAKRPLVQATFHRFTDTPTSSRYAPKLVEQAIDEAWAKLKREDREIKVKILKNGSSARNIALREITNRLDIITEWLDSSGEAIRFGNERTMLQVSELREKLKMQTLEAAAQLRYVCTAPELPLARRAGSYVLAYTLTHLSRALEGRDSGFDKWTFAPLLKTSNISLDEAALPIVDQGSNLIPGFEPWRRMLRHIAEPKVELEVARTYFTDERAGQTKWFANYGAAECVERYLAKETRVEARDLSSAYRGAEMKCKELEADFESEFRLACAYSRIEEKMKEVAFHAEQQLREFFFAHHDYAHFRSVLAMLREQIPIEAQKRRTYFETQLQKLVVDKKLTTDIAPILNYISAALQEENFALAQEYINRLRNNEYDIPAEELKIDAESDFHAEFLDCYQAYYNECNLLVNKSDYPQSWGYKSLQTRIKNHWSSPNEERKAEPLLKNWIGGKGQANTASRISLFLRALGFKASQTVKTQDLEQCEVYCANVTPQDTGLRDYDHPVAKYGTQLQGQINVACLFGCKGTSTLISIMTKKLQLHGPTIVLLEGILSLDERRIIASRFKAMTSGQSSFLLIDRVLLLYLASLDEGDRMVAMLKCTLPYTFEQLYTKGVGGGADEMFIGRIAERNDICNDGGTSLVYGGRQLGKTALLKRCRSIQHAPANRLFAVDFEIKDQGAAVMLARLQEKLIQEKLISRTYHSLDDLCDCLLNQYQKKVFFRLQIFIDEVDTFFEEAAQEDYALLRPIVNLMKNTKNKVKFVFVGLHNVAHTQSAISNNGILLQLGKPLCISPLSSTDARKLIERPLSYLGFRLGERELALILANTNSYPGLLHLFGYSLVQSVCDNYTKYYSPEKGNPPYDVADDQMKAIFLTEDLEKETNWRIRATINDLDHRYRIIANLIAYLHYEDEVAGRVNLYGYTSGEIRDVMDVVCLRSLSQMDFLSLLNEMVDMGILSSQDEDGQKLFCLRMLNFLSVIGPRDEVENYILSNLEEEMV